MVTIRYPTLLAAVPYTAVDRGRLEALAKEVLPDPEALSRKAGHPKRTLEFAAGRAAVALVFRELGWKGVVTPNTEFGYLETRSGPYVNLTHTEGVAVAVAASAPVGVDVEHGLRDASRVIRRVATDGEMARHVGKRYGVEGLEVEGALLLWSAKEAVSKAVGLGIKFGMDAFELDLSGAPPWKVKIGIEGPMSLRDPVVVATRREDHLVCLCAERSALGLPLRWVGNY